MAETTDLPTRISSKGVTYRSKSNKSYFYI